MTGTQDRLVPALADRYRLERELGQGGMATVYLAEDLRHSRKVAIKVLHPELAAVLGAERFLSEIRVTANLQHPHILPLFDSGSADGLLFYVMPYVEGETLRRRLAREHQIPIDAAVRIAVEVADALEYAHKRGIVHRDIKPENILLHEGRPVVADFGIALAVQQAGGSRMTQTGMSLGTPQYMAPEQAMGDKAVDARADVYALGAVTYEMLAGEAPFTGPTSQAIVAKVMTERPRPLGELRDTVSEGLEVAVARALQKLPADRWQTAAEFAGALQSATARTTAHATARTTLLPALQRSSGPRRAVMTVAAALALVGTFLAGRASRRPAAATAPPSWLAIMAPSVGGSGGTALVRQLALSPDGAEVTYVAASADGQNRLYRQRLDAPEATPVANSNFISYPIYSPDGHWLYGFQTVQQQTVRLPLEGGTVQALDAPALSGGPDWMGDDLVWIENSTLRRLVHGDSLASRRAEFLQGMNLQQLVDHRRALAVLRTLGQASGPLQLVDLESGDQRVVLDGQIVEARYAAGMLVYVSGDGALHAAPFDPAKVQLTGRAVTLATGVSLSGTGYAQFALSDNGTLAYIPEEPRTLVFVGRDGSSRPALAERHSFHAPVFSPDGRRLSVDFISGDGRDVWVLTLAQGTLSRATFDRDGHDATWAPDGSKIVYLSARSGVLGVYRTRPGTAEPAESLFALRELSYSGVWTADGTTLVTVAREQRGASRADIVALPNGGRGPIRPLVASPFQEEYPALSKDDRWLAFVSNQSGQAEVYVRPYDRDGDQVQVSQGGGTEPVWDPSGRALFYRGLDGMLYEATLTFEPAFTVQRRTALFSVADMVGTNPHPNFSISPDGKEFAMVRRSPANRIVVLQNLPAIVRGTRGDEAPAR